MRTVQMTLDEELIKLVDRLAKRMHTNRSAFTRQALQQAVRRTQTQELEARHQEGYLRKPVAADEFSIWEKEQKWGEK